LSGCGVRAAGQTEGRWLRAMETRMVFFLQIEHIGGQRQAQENDDHAGERYKNHNFLHHGQSISVVGLLQSCVGLGVTLNRRDNLTNLTVVFVVLQQGPGLREIGLQGAQFVVDFSSAAAGNVNLGATGIPIRQGELGFAEQPLAFVT
jgi:hypothetical protein